MPKSRRNDGNYVISKWDGILANHSGIDWLRSLGVNVINLDSEECITLLAEYIRTHPEIWNEDIGEE